MLDLIREKTNCPNWKKHYHLILKNDALFPWIGIASSHFLHFCYYHCIFNLFNVLMWGDLMVKKSMLFVEYNGDNVHRIYFNVKSNSFCLSFRPDIAECPFFWLSQLFCNTYDVLQSVRCSNQTRRTHIQIQRVSHRIFRISKKKKSCTNCNWHKF